MKVRSIPTILGIIFSLIIFSFLAVFIQGHGPDSQVEVLFGATTFIFGIIVAFYISMSTSRLNEIAKVLNTEDSNYISVYRLSAVFGAKVQQDIKELLDGYLVEQIDYYLEDFNHTKKSYQALVEYIINLKPKSEEQRGAYSQLLDLETSLQEDRIRIIGLVKQKLQSYEWVVIEVLVAIVLFCIFYLNNQTAMSIIISSLLATTIMTLMLVLRDLNYLRWKEQFWIWKCLKETFLEIGLLPYYPQTAIESKRAITRKGEKVRVVKYISPYPDFRDKVVEVVEMK